MDQIEEIARGKALYIIEDAAQALLSTYKGKYAGTIGHLGCLSFHETKNIISGEGGALLLNDERFVERAEIIREKGTNRSKFFRGEVDKYTWVDLGSSFLPSDILAAFLYAQMENAEKIIEQRNIVFSSYMRGLKSLSDQGFIQLPKVTADCQSNGHIFYIVTRALAERTELIGYLKEKGVMSVFHYIPLHNSPAGLKYGRTGSPLNITENISERLLRLPLYYEMSENDVMAIIEEIEKFYLLH
jgi:dTDP-4-amino-4,6-dideoxygalactose transaminase